MKSNKQKAGLMALVALAAIGSYFIAGTYAKYISEISGSGTATVAKWKWKINNTDITSSATNTFTFNLLETVKDSDGTSSESDVASGLLAPGMTGEFTIDITNNSEVNANYAINFSESSSNLPTGVSRLPLEYCSAADCTVAGNWNTTISQVDISAINISMNGGNATRTIKWRWPYYVDSTSDATDTALGFGANTSAATVQVTATVTVTQVD